MHRDSRSPRLENLTPLPPLLPNAIFHSLERFHALHKLAFQLSPFVLFESNLRIHGRVIDVAVSCGDGRCDLELVAIIAAILWAVVAAAHPGGGSTTSRSSVYVIDGFAQDLVDYVGCIC